MTRNEIGLTLATIAVIAVNVAFAAAIVAVVMHFIAKVW